MRGLGFPPGSARGFHPEKPLRSWAPGSALRPVWGRRVCHWRGPAPSGRLYKRPPEMWGPREIRTGWGAQPGALGGPHPPRETGGKARFGVSSRQTDRSFYVIREHSAHCVINLKILTQRNYGKYKSEKLDQDAQPAQPGIHGGSFRSPERPPGRLRGGGSREGGGRTPPPPPRTPERIGARASTPTHTCPLKHCVLCVGTPHALLTRSTHIPHAPPTRVSTPSPHTRPRAAEQTHGVAGRLYCNAAKAHGCCEDRQAPRTRVATRPRTAACEPRRLSSTELAGGRSCPGGTVSTLGCENQLRRGLCRLRIV